MSLFKLMSLTLVTMLCFAGNSVFCRLALRQTTIDAASFTTLRLLSGALVLVLLVYARRQFQGTEGAKLTATATLTTPTAAAISAASAMPAASIKSTAPPISAAAPATATSTAAVKTTTSGNWPSALALFVYASAFSWSYTHLSTGIGALLLFGAVQATMILTGLWRGERLSARQTAGLVMALGGVVAILSPGIDAPPLASALLMMASGVAWGVYSLRGRNATDPTGDTAGNFWRAALMALLVSAVLLSQAQLDGMGALYAVLSGALTSGMGYALWYAVLPKLTRTRAAAVQLSVPVLASLAGAVFVGEPLTLSLLLTSAAVLGGIAMVVYGKHSTG